MSNGDTSRVSANKDNISIPGEFLPLSYLLIMLTEHPTRSASSAWLRPASSLMFFRFEPSCLRKGVIKRWGVKTQ